MGVMSAGAASFVCQLRVTLGLAHAATGLCSNSTVLKVHSVHMN